MIYSVLSATHNVIKNNRLKLSSIVRFCFLLIIVVLLTGFSTYSVKAASGLKIYNYKTKKTSTYTGNQVKVTYNGNAIGTTNTPGILVDGVALLPFYDIFVNSGIAADYSYNKEKGTVTISKYGITIVMKIGSKVATVNGKSVTMQAAPMQIKYVAANKAKILVPSRFVSETLGLGYTWYSNKNTVAIEKYSIRLAYNNEEYFEYIGAQGKVTIDGKSIDLGSMPSVLTNNTAMLQVKKVFAASSIGAEYSYNKTSKLITLKKNGNVLLMTIGSKKAKLNSKEVNLDTPPMLVTNFETNISYVMVPGYFTSKSLGYHYSWNNATKTSVITSPKNSNTGSGDEQTVPELGDSSVVNEKGTVLNEWIGIDSTYSKSSNLHELNSGSNTVAGSGNIYFAARDFSFVKQNTETFLIASSVPFSKVTSIQDGNKISIQADNIGCTDQTYQMYGTSSNYVNTLGLFYEADRAGTRIDLEVLPADYLYDISLSSDSLILYVTIYQNTITSATVGVNTAGDYLSLTGISALKVDLTEQSDLMYLELPYTLNSIGDISTEISGSKYIKQIFAVASSDKTQIVLALNEGYEYYIMESGNQYTLSFQTPEGTVQPEELTDTPVNPGIPTVGDISKYEIVIPISSDMSISTITNEDFYFNNYFVIRIPGNYKDFYSNRSITNNAQAVNKISVSVNSSNITEIKVATSKLQGYEIAFDSENLYINVGNPKDIYKNIVVLDPGHGGAANGAQYFGTKEKDINFTILYQVGKKYFNSDPSKLKVYYTRTSDNDLALSNRAAFVKSVDADLFVSLHMNAADANVNGTEVFYSNSNNAANRSGLTSQKLASYFVTNLTKTLNTNSRGVKQEKYTVIHKNTVPAVLIELGFMSNKNEHDKLIDGEFQNKAAKSIYDTLLQVFNDYPTGR